jgi:hypothetical protein
MMKWILGLKVVSDEKEDLDQDDRLLDHLGKEEDIHGRLSKILGCKVDEEVCISSGDSRL